MQAGSRNSTAERAPVKAVVRWDAYGFQRVTGALPVWRKEAVTENGARCKILRIWRNYFSQYLY